MTLESKLIQWCVYGETGLSSKAIVAVMAGLEIITDRIRNNYPHDPSDFNRCLKLIRDIPEIRPRLNEMATVSEQWSKIVSRWDEVEKCFMEEVPEWLDDQGRNKSAPKTMQLMRSIYGR